VGASLTNKKFRNEIIFIKYNFHCYFNLPGGVLDLSGKRCPDDSLKCFTLVWTSGSFLLFPFLERMELSESVLSSDCSNNDAKLRSKDEI